MDSGEYLNLVFIFLVWLVLGIITFNRMSKRYHHKMNTAQIIYSLILAILFPHYFVVANYILLPAVKLFLKFINELFDEPSELEIYKDSLNPNDLALINVQEEYTKLYNEILNLKDKLSVVGDKQFNDSIDTVVDTLKTALTNETNEDIILLTKTYIPKFITLKV